MTRFVKRAASSLAAVVVIACLALAAGVLVPRGGADVPASDGEGARVLLIANAIHTDLVLPATPEIRERFAFLAEDGLPLDHPGTAHLVIGWGGRDFYINTPSWAELRFVPAAKALTLDRSVMHVSLSGPLDEEAPDVRCFLLGQAALERLLSAIEARFERDGDGEPLVIEGVSYTPYDRFYESDGWFNILVGCNTFTASALRAAGFTTGMWTPLPQALLLSLDLYGPAQC